MTEQSITVTKIEPVNGNPDTWWVQLNGVESIMRKTDEVRAMGLTLPTPPVDYPDGMVIRKCDSTAVLFRKDGEWRGWNTRPVDGVPNPLDPDGAILPEWVILYSPTPAIVSDPDSLTITIGDHTTTINRDDAEMFAEAWPSLYDPGYPTGSVSVALADLIRTALEDQT